MKIVNLEAYNSEYRFILKISEISENQYSGNLIVLTNPAAVILEPGVKPVLIREVKNEEFMGKSVNEVQEICEKRLREFEGGELSLEFS
ncbi:MULTISPECIES: hypothetical protein [Leptolyngbya]|uniref:hypothetical protein n=1 Tax=Leptolyngbya TaxID=47251 RepID=UPI00168973F5|nr:hypothetical protein [Leptolyngbya sp. FACHB-1624]MBD1855580.1 hypothetical protein [Leptolyngbya sp. FACHB-1624]